MLAFLKKKKRKEKLMSIAVYSYGSFAIPFIIHSLNTLLLHNISFNHIPQLIYSTVD
jgi:hypothetical protein